MFSTAWKNWGPGEHRLKLCIDCWDYWRKYAGLKFITKWGTQLLDCTVHRRVGGHY